MSGSGEGFNRMSEGTITEVSQNWQRMVALLPS